MLKVNNKLLIFICVFVGVCEQYILASVLNMYKNYVLLSRLHILIHQYLNKSKRYAWDINSHI